MTKREFAVLAVRLLALYVVATSFNALTWISTPFLVARTAPVWQQWLLCLMPFTLRAASGWFLWLFAVPLAQILVETNSEDQLISSWQPRQITRLGIAFIGLLSLLQSVYVVGQTLAQLSLAW